VALCDYLDDNSSAAKLGLRTVSDSRPEGDSFRAFALDLLSLIDIHEQKGRVERFLRPPGAPRRLGSRIPARA